MASYIPGVTDTSLETPFYSQDWSFLQQQQNKANQQYEQGLQQVKSDYSAIINRPVTNTFNIQKKAEYIKQAQESLKRIAPQDLSLPQNVQQAESAFAPFWEDGLLLQDAYLTKKYQNQRSKGLAVRDSKDEDLRKTFDPRSIELLDYQLNNLRNAPREEVGNIQIDDWTPFYNVQGDLSDHKVADKMEVTFDIPTGDGRMMKVTNGPGSISNYRTYGDGIIDKRYEKQYETIGKLDTEKALLQYQQLHPGSTRQDAMKELGTQLHQVALESYKSRVEDYNHTIATKQELLKKVTDQVATQQGKATPAQNTSIQQLTAEINAYTARYNQLDKNYKDLQKPDALNAIILHPEAIFAENSRAQDIDRWATSMAADQSIEYSKDDAFWEREHVQLGNRTLEETIRSHKVDEQIALGNLAVNQYRAQIDAQKLTAEHPELFGGSSAGRTYTGDATNVEFARSRIDAANAERQAVYDNIYGTLYNPNELGSVIINNIPDKLVDYNQRIGFLDVMNRLASGQITEYKDAKGVFMWAGSTPKDREAYQKTIQFLTNETGIPIHSYKDVPKAMIAFTKKTVDQLTISGASNTPQFTKLSNAYTFMKDNMNIYEQDEAERAHALADYIKSNPTKYRDIIINGRIANEQDIKPYLNQIDIRDEQGNRVDPDILARVFTNGQLKGQLGREGGGTFTIGDKVYTIPQRWDFERYTGPSSETIYNNLVRRFGNSQDFAAKKNAIENEVISKTTLYNKANNIVGPRIASYIGDKFPSNQKMLSELVSPGNYTAMYEHTVGNNAVPIPGAATQKAVMDLVNSPDLKDYIGLKYDILPKSFNGKPMVEISVNDIPDVGANKAIPANIKALSGKTIYIEKSPTAKGTYINTFPKSADFSMHPLNRGETVTSDPLQNTLGQSSWTATPFPSINPNTYIVHFKKNLFSHQTGQVKDTATTMNLPVDEHNPYEVINTLNQIQLNNGINFYKNIDLYRNPVK